MISVLVLGWWWWFNWRWVQMTAAVDSSSCRHWHRRHPLLLENPKWFAIPVPAYPDYPGKQVKGSVKEPNMFHNYQTEKITRKANDAAENLQLYRVVQFFRQRSLCTMTHLMLFSERPHSADICVVHDDLGWKNWTHYNRFWRAGCSQLEYIDIRSVY